MQKRNIYVASSWRNHQQGLVVSMLKLQGHDVYDFKNPPNRSGFAWSEIDPNWESWSSEQYVAALRTKRAVDGFDSDFNAMKAADTCVLVLPCGRSAHLEAGWFVGAGKELYIFSPETHEPELMYKMCNGILLDFGILTQRFRIDGL